MYSELYIKAVFVHGHWPHWLSMSFECTLQVTGQMVELLSSKREGDPRTLLQLELTITPNNFLI